MEDTVLIFLCVCDYCKTHVNPETCVCAHVYNEQVSFPVFVHAYIYMFIFLHINKFETALSALSGMGMKKGMFSSSPLLYFFVCFLFLFILYVELKNQSLLYPYTVSRENDFHLKGNPEYPLKQVALCQLQNGTCFCLLAR